MRLEGRRILVVGASSGMGRETGLAAAAEGARVAFAARRLERVQEAAKQAGDGCIGLECDVTNDESCDAVVAAAVEALGGLDALVYAAGTGVFKALSDTDGSDWRQVLDTNLVGATLIMRAAAPHIGAVRGKAVFFTSISIDDAPPRSNFANYVVSKVAMEALVRAWQGEHHAIGFTTVAMGDTLTEYGTGVPADVLGPIVERWVGEGYMYGSLMDATTVAAHVIHALACPDTIRRVAITPAYAPEGQEAAELYDRPS